jgi:hypothetical protein
VAIPPRASQLAFVMANKWRLGVVGGGRFGCREAAQPKTTFPKQSNASPLSPGFKISQRFPRAMVLGMSSCCYRVQCYMTIRLSGNIEAQAVAFTIVLSLNCRLSR